MSIAATLETTTRPARQYIMIGSRGVMLGSTRVDSPKAGAKIMKAYYLQGEVKGCESTSLVVVYLADASKDEYVVTLRMARDEITLPTWRVASRRELKSAILKQDGNVLFVTGAGGVSFRITPGQLAPAPH